MVMCVKVGLGYSNRYGVSANWCFVFANIVRVVKHELILAHDTHFSIDVSRNHVIRSLLPYNPDYIFIIDTDIFPLKCSSTQCSIFYDVINYMIDNYSNYDVIGVYHYSKKIEPNVYEFGERKTLNNIDVYELRPMKLNINSGVHRVDAFGIGLVMIKPEIFNTLPYPWFRIEVVYDSNTKTEIVIGEDVYFFYKCRKHNINVYVTTDIIAMHESQLYLFVDSRVFNNPFATIFITNEKKK